MLVSPGIPTQPIAKFMVKSRLVRPSTAEFGIPRAPDPGRRRISDYAYFAEQLQIWNLFKKWRACSLQNFWGNKDSMTNPRFQSPVYPLTPSTISLQRKCTTATWRAELCFSSPSIAYAWYRSSRFLWIGKEKLLQYKPWSQERNPSHVKSIQLKSRSI